jgi:hypothetical protein
MDNDPAYGYNGTYSTYLYGGRAEEVVHSHPVSEPLFLYLPWHVTHNPLEAPPEVIVPVPQDPGACRTPSAALFFGACFLYLFGLQAACAAT